MVFVVSASFALIDRDGRAVSRAGVYHALVESSSSQDAKESMERFIRSRYGKEIQVSECVATPKYDMMFLPR